MRSEEYLGLSQTCMRAFFEKKLTYFSRLLFLQKTFIINIWHDPKCVFGDNPIKILG